MVIELTTISMPAVFVEHEVWGPPVRPSIPRKDAKGITFHRRTYLAERRIEWTVRSDLTEVITHLLTAPGAQVVETLPVHENPWRQAAGEPLAAEPTEVRNFDNYNTGAQSIA